MSGSSDSIAHRRVQYAALPYRQRQDGEVQVRLITSRETRRWVIPKGWPMKGLAPHKAAAREAFEEAGLLGSTSRNAVGMYTYEKRLSPQRSLTCDVMVFPMRVKRYLKKWPERSQRIGFWFTIESAAAAVQEEELRDLILRFGATMAARFAEAEAARAVQGEEELATDLGGEGAQSALTTKSKSSTKVKAAAAGSKSETKAKSQAKVKTEAKVKTKARPEAVSKPELEDEPETKTKRESKLEPQSGLEPGGSVKSKSKAKPAAEPKTLPPFADGAAGAGVVAPAAAPHAKSKLTSKAKGPKAKSGTKAKADAKAEAHSVADDEPKAKPAAKVKGVTKAKESGKKAALAMEAAGGEPPGKGATGSLKKKIKRASDGATLH